eukprot:5031347-Amphidinium_carterae.1
MEARLAKQIQSDIGAEWFSSLADYCTSAVGLWNSSTFLGSDEWRPIQQGPCSLGLGVSLDLRHHVYYRASFKKQLQAMCPSMDVSSFRRVFMARSFGHGMTA